MIRRNQIQGLSVLALAAFLLFALARAFYPLIPAATQGVLVWAGLESLAAFCLLSGAMHRSNRAFYSIFAGGSLTRLLSLGVIAWRLDSHGASPVIPLLALVMAYFLFSLIQIPFFSHGLR